MQNPTFSSCFCLSHLLSALARLHCALGRLHRAVARLHCDQSTDLNLIYMQPRNECGMKSSHGAATEWTSHGARPQISTNLTYCFSKTSRAGFARTPECVPTRCPLCLPIFFVFLLEAIEVAVVLWEKYNGSSSIAVLW